MLQKLGFINSYLWARSAADIRTWVLDKGPVVLGTTWYTSMFEPDSKGFIKTDGEPAGGHAYICVGYSHKRDAFRCVNSWGEGWGQKGKFWIKSADMDKLMAEYGEACTAMESEINS